MCDQIKSGRLFHRLSLVLLAVTLGVLGCDGSADDSETLLTGQTYHLEFDEDSADIDENCPPSTSESSLTTVTDGMLALHDSGFVNADFTISFGEGTFITKWLGDEIDEGTWRGIDSNTIEITLGDYTGLVDIAVHDGTHLIFKLTPESARAFCVAELPNTAESEDDEDDDTDTPNPDTSDPDVSVGIEPIMAGVLDGTWCYESGYLFYVAVVIDVGDGDNPGYAVYESQAAPEEDNAGFLDGTAVTLNYATRDVGINEFQQTAWIETNRKSGSIDSLAPITPDPADPTRLTIAFGDDKDAIFLRSDSEVDGECQDLVGNP